MTYGTTMSMATGQALDGRIAAAPISWGVCEVPNWGAQLSAETVLAAMRSLGIAATEAGPDGYLGVDPAAARALLERNGLVLVGGFLPLVLHDPAQLEASLEKVRTTAAFFSQLGARVICSSVVVDYAWAPPVELSDAEWGHLLAALPAVDAAAAEHGIVQSLHPHWGTLVERDAEVRRVLEGSNVGVCLDTGHLALGGSDPLALLREYPGRFNHVHLKDVDGGLAERLRAGEFDLVEGVRRGIFRPLGAGDAPIGGVVAALEQSGYRGWYVLEQDTALADTDPTSTQRLLDDVRQSVKFLRAVAPATTPD